VGGPVHHPGLGSQPVFREEVVLVAEKGHPRIRLARACIPMIW
jgi:hypothetical protein